MTKVTFTLDDETVQAIRALAARKKKSRSLIVREAVAAYSADRGEKLLEIDTGIGSGAGPPITYRIGGRQYISLLGGIGRAAALLTDSPFAAADTPPPKLLTFTLDAAASTPITQH
jgi:hypothetical protein